MSGFLTTETISPSSGFVGRQRLESFSLFPQALGIIRPQRYPSKRKIKSRRNLRGSYFVVSHPSQSQLSFRAFDPWDSAVFPGAEVPSPSESTVWIHLLVSLFPLMPSPQRRAMQCRRGCWGLIGATETS